MGGGNIEGMTMNRTGNHNRNRLKRVLTTMLVGLGLVASSTPVQAQEDESVPILQVDLSYLSLNPQHELVGKLDEENLAEDILKKQNVLAGAGAALVMRRISVTSLGEEEIMIQMGREVSVVTGRQVGAGRVATSVQSQSVGTLVRITPTIAADKVLLKITFEASYLAPADEEAGEGFPEMKTVTAQFTSPVVYDKPTVVYDATEGGDTEGRNLCLITVKQLGEFKQVAAVTNLGGRNVAGLAGLLGGGDGGNNAGGFARRAQGRGDAGAQGRGDRGRGDRGRGAAAGGNAGGFRPPRGPVNEEDAEARFGRFFDAIMQRYDANNDGKLEVAEIDSERLKGYDFDGDGVVTLAELSQGLTADGPRQREPVKDADGAEVEETADGDTEEAVAEEADADAKATAEKASKYLAYAKGMIKKYDTNEDGSLSADEWEKMSRSPAKADTDEDGLITAEELARSYMK